ncbi:MAG: hypothetical protein IJZ16_13050 [Clostridia bacterium]|nr:hypothetical protein [Clostridia bacterium]
MHDGYTNILTGKINDWGLDKIYEMEDDIYGLENRVPEIIDYLKDIHFSMPLGLALRRYICEQYSSGFDTEGKCYRFSLPEKVIFTKDYTTEDYDIETDDITEYIEIFNYINAKFNTDGNGNLTIDIPKAEIRRQLRATTGCIRKKMFDLSFALHMDSEYTSKFLTDVLAEQTYNYREPKEIIALFCQSNEEFNCYQKYDELCKMFDLKSKDIVITKEKKENYTSFARKTIIQEIKTEEMLIEFLLTNITNFYMYSETAYNEFVSLYIKASSSLLPSDKKLSFEGKTIEERINVLKEFIKNDNLINPEQLAKEMLACIPRATTERIKNGKKIVSNDFINIYNGENGQDSKKVKTTELPKRITMNLPVSDRLWDLIRREKPVDRKDIVFMKFYVFSLYLQEKDEYSAEDYFIFLDECNDLLVRCGMSRLYPGNRFENLIMLSLLASNPFEMFENIIEFSFMNEPQPNLDD